MTLAQPRRSLRRMMIVVASVVAAVVVGMWRVTSGSGPTVAHAAGVERLPDSVVLEQDIEFYRMRAANDPTGATDLARLGSLYLRRSREIGDPRDAVKAEELARASLENRRGHNDEAAQILGSSLLSQHRFTEALAISKELRDRNPQSAPLRAAVAEIQMELGQYDSARVTFTALRNDANDLAIAPRLARWAEVEGRTDDARRMMRRALKIASKTSWLPREQMAWYRLRAGDIELRAGRFAAADSAYRAGLAAHPGDYRLLAAMSHLAAIEHRWRDAIAYGDQALAANLDPATLGIVSDAYAALGDTARSEEYAKTLDVAVRSQPGAYHRAWSLFLLDHGRQMKTVDRKIREELHARQDVYGYDLLAWSLYKQGRTAESRKAMAKALSQGTQDAQLFYHNCIIERAAGNDSVATDYLARARALNPSLR